MPGNATQPTLDSLALVLPQYGARFDRTLAAARDQIGPHCNPGNPVHAVALRSWLNKWICRLRVPEPSEPDPFVANLADWWDSCRAILPGESVTLAGLRDVELRSIADAYGELEPRTAALNRNGRARRFGPTATAKILYFVRPQAVTAWDKAISRHVPGHGSAAFLAHLQICRSWAKILIAEGTARGLTENDIGSALGRPMSSVAKLIDEWLYRTVTGGLDPAQP